MISGQIYLDYAAATPLDKAVRAAMAAYESEQFYNPSALYEPARKVKKALDDARTDVAQFLAAKSTEVIFTAGATESINLAFSGVLKNHAGNVVVSAIEHESVMAAAEGFGRKVKVCPVSSGGIIEVEAFAQSIDDDTVLVSIGYANNEIGTIAPLSKIGQKVEEIRQDRAHRGVTTPLYLHSDASQAANYLDIKPKRLGVDLLTLNAGKVYGPKGVGCLYVKAGLELSPLIYGGGQERGLRSGTENVAGIIGFAKALQLAAKLREAESQRLTELRDYAYQQIRAAVPIVNLNGDPSHRIPSNLNLSIPSVPGETLVHYLDRAGIAVATGAACSANADTPSHVLVAIGLNKEEVDSSLRISLGRPTTKAEIDKFVQTLAKVVEQLRTSV